MRLLSPERYSILSGRPRISGIRPELTGPTASLPLAIAGLSANLPDL